MNTNTDEFDRRARAYVYDITLRRGYPPSIVETSDGLQARTDEVRASFNRLAARRVLVLQRDSGEILMANPFSAVPTPFLVETKGYRCFGNCIWDAMGIPAMLKQDAVIRASCGDCGTTMNLKITNSLLEKAEGIVHFAIPAAHWWDDIVFN